jgi:bile acid:Na+ symporter, BASS family
VLRLGIKLNILKCWLSRPKPVLLGVFSQFIALPALTFLLVILIRPTPSVAMGMILVAACPGEYLQFYLFTGQRQRGAFHYVNSLCHHFGNFYDPFQFCTCGANFMLSFKPVIPISIDPVEMLKTVVILLGIPVVLGIAFANRFPQLTQKIMKPFRTISSAAFPWFYCGAFSSNFSYFLKYIHLIILIVLAHNALALLTGFSIATLVVYHVPIAAHYPLKPASRTQALHWY